jgi:hypothetical protein
MRPKIQQLTVQVDDYRQQIGAGELVRPITRVEICREFASRCCYLSDKHFFPDDKYEKRGNFARSKVLLI